MTGAEHPVEDLAARRRDIRKNSFDEAIDAIMARTNFDKAIAQAASASEITPHLISRVSAFTGAVSALFADPLPPIRFCVRDGAEPFTYDIVFRFGNYNAVRTVQTEGALL